MTAVEPLLSLAEQAAAVIRPLQQALSSEVDFARALRRFGWEVDPASFSIQTVRVSVGIDGGMATVDARFGAVAVAAGGLPPIQAYLDLFDALRTVMGILRDLPAAAPPPGIPADAWSTFRSEVLDALLVDYLAATHGAIAAVLLGMGVIEADEVDTGGVAGRVPYTRRQIAWDRLPRLVTDPVGLMRDTYGWRDGAGLRFDVALARLGHALDLLGLPAEVRFPATALLDEYYDAANPSRPQARELKATLMAGEDAAGNSLDASLLVMPIPEPTEPAGPPRGLLISPSLQTSAVPPAELLWEYSIALSGTGGRVAYEGARLELLPSGVRAQLATTGAATIDATALLRREFDVPAVLLGSIFSHRLELDGYEFGIASRGPLASPELALRAAIQKARLVVDAGGADGFLASVLGGSTWTFEFAAGIEWSSQSGVHIEGSGAVEARIPLNFALGPIQLRDLLIRVAAETGTLAVTAGVSGSLALGPFTAVVENVGMRLSLTPVAADQPPGVFGELDLGFAFKPPDGLGLGVQAGPVTGGGFVGFDEVTGRYSGALALSIGEIGVSAFGLLDTRLPGGQQGYALLVLLRATFPPIQIGFGFALSSIGGLLALNRRIDADALRARIATGTAGRILAPEDPLRDAPVLLTDLAAVFPPIEGVVVVGPTLQLSWVEFVRFDLGIFVELPQLKVLLLGSARAAIPNPAGGRALLQIRLDIVGLLDFQKQVLEFDAVLVDSYLLEILELSGGAAFRLSWGDEPYVVLTVGGFHPGYSPAPLAFPPSLTRVAMVRGAPTDLIYLRFEGYFAVTTNTLQLGAAVELIINAGPINLRGFLGFDALVLFQPFSFEVAVEASVSIRWRGRRLGGVDFRGTLTGPGPVTLHGKVCFEILFFDICWEETFTLGSSGRPAVTPVASAVAELAQDLGDPRNLASSGGDDPRVALAPEPSGLAVPVVRPLGQLAWSQERAPLDLLLERFQGAPLARPETVAATGNHVSAPEEDWFAPGGFADLSESEALNRPPFERLHGGVRLGVSGVADGRPAVHAITVDQIRLPQPPSPGFDLTLPAWLLRAADGRVGILQPAAIAGAVAVDNVTWTVHDAAAGVLADGVSQSQAHQLARNAPAAAAAVAATDQVPTLAF